MSWFQELAQNVASGIAAGAMYGLIAVGISLIYRTTRLFNFAQGHLAALGAYVAWSLTAEYELPYMLSLLVSAFVVGLLMVVVERLTLRPLYAYGMLLPMLSTIGLSFAIQAFIGVQWGQIGKTFPPAFPTAPFELGGVILVPALLWIAFFGAVTALAIFLFLRFAKSGLAMRSVALDRTASSLLGIPVSRSFTYTAFASGALAAVAGTLIAPVTYMQPSMGLQLSTLGFVAALIGGLGSIQGAFIGGLLVGAAQNVAVLFIDPSLKDVVAYVLLAVFLVVKPTGIFGEEGLRVREV